MNRVLVAALACFTTACSLDVTNKQGQPSLIRVVNAAPGTTSVQAFLNAAAEPLSGTLSYRTQSEGCFFIFPTTQTVVFVEAAKELASASNKFASEGEYTALLTGAGTTYRAVVMDDAGAATAGNNSIRLINGTGTAGDVYVTPASAAPGPSYLARANLPAIASSTEAPVYVQRPTTDVRVRLFDVGTTTTARSDVTITSVSENRRVTIVFVPRSDPSDSGALFVFPCN